MGYRLLADAVVLLHLGFIVFALLGGLSVLWRRWMLLLHAPAAVWAVLISVKGWICPLTPLENKLRQAAGSEGISGGFVEHYIIPVVYPDALTETLQTNLGFVALGVNALVYSWICYRYFRGHNT